MWRPKCEKRALDGVAQGAQGRRESQRRKEEEGGREEDKELDSWETVKAER